MMRAFPVERIRGDFPILGRTVHGKPLVYLDNAATTQKPQAVLEGIVRFYSERNANIHRGVHLISEEASAAYEAARKTVQRFINAASENEIIFSHGATDSINMVAHSFGEKYVTMGDEIIISEMEHHSNMVPWQVLCEKKGARLRTIPFDDDARLRLEDLDGMITDRTRLIAVTYVSNALGTVNPVREIMKKARAHAIPVLIDGAQAIQHMPVDVQEIGCDFFVFSGHKIYAETGVGVLYAKEGWLESLPPYQSGGGMIERVALDKTTFAGSPSKFEAGTPNIAGALSIAASMEYLSGVGMESIAAHEKRLLEYARETLSRIEGVRLYGCPPARCAAVSFDLAGASPYDTAVLLDKMGIAVRAGTHCAEPVMRHYGVSGTVRVSFGLYNTIGEIDLLAGGLVTARELLAA